MRFLRGDDSEDVGYEAVVDRDVLVVACCFEDGYLEGGEIAASVCSGGDFGEADARVVFDRSDRLFQLARHCCERRVSSSPSRFFLFLFFFSL